MLLAALRVLLYTVHTLVCGTGEIVADDEGVSLPPCSDSCVEGSAAQNVFSHTNV